MAQHGSHGVPPDESAERAVHARHAEAFARAASAAPGELIEQVFTVGGRSVSCRIVGTDLAHIFGRAMLPGAVNDRPDLRLDLWDEAACGQAAPERGDDDPYPDRAEFGERLMVSPGRRHARLSSPDFEIHLDRPHQHVVGWIRSAQTLSYWHRARPLRSLLTPWMADGGQTVLHAAMVAKDQRGLVLAAPTRSGKSTCAAACGSDGFDVLGDDTVAIDRRDGIQVGHAVHTAVKLRREGLARHGAVASRLATAGFPWTDDAVAYVGELFPGRLVSSAPVTAIAFPRLGSAPATTFERLPRAAALRSLVGCLLTVDSRDLGDGFEAASAILEDVPAYRVTVGQATAQIPSGLAALLEDAAR
jgi:hypothetical protein